MIFDLHTPARLDRYTDDRVGTFRSVKFPPPEQEGERSCPQNTHRGGTSRAP